MAEYYPISEAEMSEFLVAQGFQPVSLPGTLELVWGKIVRRGSCVCSLRVYSGINPNGASRDVGKDAIRVTLHWRDAGGVIQKVGGSKRVHRVRGWRDNLQNRIDKWEEALGPPCPKCAAPMVQRTVKKDGPNKGKKFWSCVTWKATKCQGSIWPKREAA